MKALATKAVRRPKTLMEVITKKYRKEWKHLPPVEIAPPMRRKLNEENPDAVLFDGLEKAIIGIGSQYSKPTLAIYSASKIVKVLMKRDKMNFGEAIEFFDFNIADLWAGEHTPIIVDDL